MTEGLVVALAVLLLLSLRRRMGRAAVHGLTAATGLATRSFGPLWTGSAAGERRGFRVEVEADVLGTMEFRIMGPLSDRFEFATRAVTRARFWRRPADSDVVGIGDPRFAGVTGDPAAALSCLHADARNAIVLAADYPVSLRRGRLVCRIDPMRRDADEIVRVLDDLIALASTLSVREPGPEALLHNALHDPLDEVRDRNAVQLVTQFAESEEARVFLELTRARAANGEPWDGLASLLAPSVRVDYLERSDPREVALRVRTTKPPLLERLLKGLSVSGKPGEAVLVAVVALDPDDITSNLALSLLAETAAISAIEPLRAARTFVSGVAFDNAIGGIKSRAGEGARPGQLSIPDAPSSTGAVSVATQAGALSPAAGPRRRE